MGSTICVITGEWDLCVVVLSLTAPLPRSNHEIADLRFWRSPQYQAFFEYLDLKGGIYYERWGDAPIHSIAVTLFLERSRLHHFWDMGVSAA